jgi:hypothetical protein
MFRLKPKMRFLLLLILLCSSTQFVKAQTYYLIDHLSGTKTIGTIPIKVTQIVNPKSTSVICETGPYVIGNTTYDPSNPWKLHDGYLYEFSIPVTNIRLRTTNVSKHDTIAIFINGSFYPVSPSQISAGAWPASCGSPQPISISVGGLVTKDTAAGNCRSWIDIEPSFAIDSIRVQFMGAKEGHGLEYSLLYGTSPHVYVNNILPDTLFCANDSLDIYYALSDQFDTNNHFSIQMSDINGNFSNGVIIGSTRKYLPGSVRCHIPANTPQGYGYRYRVISTIPADTSAVSTQALSVTKFPVVTASNSGPVCDGDSLHFSLTSDDPGATYIWSGPAQFADSTASPSIKATLAHNGTFQVTASAQGCSSKVYTTVAVKRIPSIDSVSNNSPVCEGDILKFFADGTNEEGTVFTWKGPAAFSSTERSPAFNDVLISAHGEYIVSATLNGCTSPAVTTFATVHPRPAVPTLTANNPITPGDEITFTAISTDGSSFSWTGPNNFTSSEQNPAIKEADVETEGSYHVTATLGICSSGNTINIDVLQNARKYFVLPNPSSGIFRVKGNFLVNKTLPYEIVTHTGQVIRSGELATTTKYLSENFNVEGIANGVYFLRLQTKDDKLNIRFVVNK